MRGLRHAAAGLLDAADVGVPGKHPAGLDRDIHSRPARNIVDDDRAGERIRRRGIVRDEPRLRAFVVIRRDHQHGIRAHRRSDTAQLQRVSRVVRTGTGDDLASSGAILDRVRDERELFVVRHGGGLAGRAADDDGVDASRELQIQQPVHDGKIDRTLIERRDDRGRNALKHRIFQRIAPFGLISL